MKKTLSQLLSLALLVLFGLFAVGCSEQEQLAPNASKRSGARSSGEVQPLVDPSGTDNRGRIQIQGIDMTQGEVSWPWARDTPPPKTEAITELDYMYNNLTTRQKQDRTEAYQKAKNFINAGPYTVTGPAIMRSFRNNNPRDPSIRIDIEIRAGTAFN